MGGHDRALPICFWGNVVIFEKTVKGVNRAELERFSWQAQRLAHVAGEVSILITTDRRMRSLNRRFRKKDKTTDVLSFPRPEGGDIAISAPLASKNAARYGHPVREEMKVLILHGMLHLSGHDHETDRGQMAALELRLRAKLKLPGSLIERTAPAKPPRAGRSR